MNSKALNNFEISALTPADQSWIETYISQHWGSTKIVSRGQIYNAAELPGFSAKIAGKPVGLITYHFTHEACEIVTIDSWRENLGVGTALIAAIKIAAAKTGCTRLWLITSNDNIPAIQFYQKRGFQIATIHRNAIEKSRLLKPQISRVGYAGIPIRDEIEFEIILK
jgi:ribosomal protein S18 acetylase RimI-like enzyme